MQTQILACFTHLSASYPVVKRGKQTPQGQLGEGLTLFCFLHE
jgi:hypothetical protein